MPDRVAIREIDARIARTPCKKVPALVQRVIETHSHAYPASNLRSIPHDELMHYQIGDRYENTLPMEGPLSFMWQEFLLDSDNERFHTVLRLHNLFQMYTRTNIKPPCVKAAAYEQSHDPRSSLTHVKPTTPMRRAWCRSLSPT